MQVMNINLWPKKCSGQQLRPLRFLRHCGSSEKYKLIPLHGLMKLAQTSRTPLESMLIQPVRCHTHQLLPLHKFNSIPEPPVEEENVRLPPILQKELGSCKISLAPIGQPITHLLIKLWAALEASPFNMNLQRSVSVVSTRWFITPRKCATNYIFNMT